MESKNIVKTWNVYYYQTPRGDYPVKNFIEKQNIAVQTKISRSINLLYTKGPFLKLPYIKKLQDKLYELRISGQLAVRIFYSPKNDSYYLLHAFKKKSEKTPSRDLKTAIDRIKEII